MKMKHRLLYAALLCVLVLGMVLCACGEDTGNTVAVTGLSVGGTGVNNGQLNLMMGGRDIPLSATVRPSNATDKTVTWSSSDTAVVTVSEEGLLSIVGEGTATVTATAGNCSDSIQVTVAATVSVSSVGLSSTEYVLAIPTGTSATLDLSGEVKILPEDATTKTVLWSVEPQLDTVTINAQGTLIVSPNVDINTVLTVTATSVDNPEATASATVTLTRTEATGIVVRLASNGAQKPESYVYEFNLDDQNFTIYFVAETRPVGAVGKCTFASSNPEVCDVVVVDSDGNTVEADNQAYLLIKSEGEATITVNIQDTDIVKNINIKINPAAGYVFEDLNVTAEELQTTVDYSNWWDFNVNPTPKTDSLFYSLQEPTGNLGLFYSGLDGTAWNSKMNPSQGNGAYVEDGGYCTVFTVWDWPLDNTETNAYIFNKVHTPAGATTFRVQLRTQSSTYLSGMARFRIRLVDANDLSNYIFLDVNGQLADGFTPLNTDRPLEDNAVYESGSFDPENGWILINTVPDYNIGADWFFCTIAEEWRDKDVYIFIENDAIHEDDGYGNIVEGKCDALQILAMGFVSNANNQEEFINAQ